MKLSIILLMLLFVSCSKTPEEMSYSELLNTKAKGDISMEQYYYYKIMLDEKNIENANNKMEDFLIRSKDTTLNIELRDYYKKRAGYWKRSAKYWSLTGDKQMTYGRDSLRNK